MAYVAIIRNNFRGHVPKRRDDKIELTHHSKTMMKICD